MKFGLKVENHVHKYKRVDIGGKGYIIYRCMIPGCSHYLPTKELIINRETLCWDCNRITVYTQEMYNRKIMDPLCEDCRQKRIERREELKAL